MPALAVDITHLLSLRSDSTDLASWWILPVLGLAMLATMRVTSTGAAAGPAAPGACVSEPLLRKLPSRGASKRLRASENSSRIS